MTTPPAHPPSQSTSVPHLNPSTQGQPGPGTHYRSKTLAAWLALLLGSLGLHRFYLRGFGDWLGWLHPVPTAMGVLGVDRLRNLGQDDPWVWVLLPLLGLMISQAMLTAIYYALTSDERWDERHNPGQPVTSTTWGPVFAAVLAMLLGGGVLMGTIAYSGQKFFEWQHDKSLSSEPST